MRVSPFFIPPRSPNFGGLWERLVKSVKFHFKRIVGNALLTYEEVFTLSTQIKSIINSRPLTPLSDHPADLQILTPAHFLIGKNLVSLPEPNLQVIPDNRLDRWQRIEQLKQISGDASAKKSSRSSKNAPSGVSLRHCRFDLECWYSWVRSRPR